MVVTEIPKVTDDMVSGDAMEKEEGKPFMLFGREFSRKQVCAAGAGILCAALLIGGGGYAITHADWTGKANVPAVSQSKDDEEQDMALILEVKADGWDADTSTPVIAHIEDADGKVDFYTAIAANKQVTVKVGESGTYTVTFISPVNADGSIYKVPSKKVTAGKADKTVATGVTFDKVDADKVTKDDLTAIAKDVAEAVKKGDSTLTGDKGAEVVKKFEDNIKKNPNADTDAVEKETEKAQETAKRSPTRRPRKLPTARRAIQAHPTAPRRIMGRPQAAPIILETKAIHLPRKTKENPIASRVVATAATPAQTPIQAVHRKRMTPRRISTTGLPRQKPSITTLSTRPSTTTR